MAGRMVEFPSNGRTTKGYLATPAQGKGPGVLVLQEWWGLVGHIKNVCDRFAAEGFSALAPDMYHGKTATEPDEAGKLFMALNIGQAEKDLRGASRSSRSIPPPRRSAPSVSAWEASSRSSRRPSTRRSAPASTSTAFTRTSRPTTRSCRALCSACSPRTISS